MGNMFGKVESEEVKPEVTEKEKAALDKPTGPNPTPAFGKIDERDENVQLTDPDQLEKIKEGSAASSGSGDPLELEAANMATDTDSVQYVSPQIARLRVGRFQFENGRLTLDKKAAGDFEKLLATASTRTQQAVRKIDREAGEAVAQRFVAANKGHMTRGGETTASSAPAPKPSEQSHKA